MVKAHRPQLARAANAASPRTLVQILLESVERFPDSSALDDGRAAPVIVLPAAQIRVGGSVGPASLVMRGETVPPATGWIGNPVSPWTDPPAMAPAPVPAREGREP